MLAREKPASGAAVTGRKQVYCLHDQVGHLMRRAHQRHTAIFQAGIGDSQLTPLQLATLVKARDEGAVSQNQLGRLTAMDPATSLGVIRRLCAKGLMERSADAKDRRRSVLRVSPAGEALLDSVIPAAVEISRATLEPLTAAERRSFLALLHKLA